MTNPLRYSLERYCFKLSILHPSQKLDEISNGRRNFEGNILDLFGIQWVKMKAMHDVDVPRIVDVVSYCYLRFCKL